MVEAARTRLIEPAFAGIAAEGAPYRGVIFCEMMVTAEGPKLVEFNVRFGDPECQVLMLRLESDIVPYLLAAATGGLAELPPPVWRDEAAICVVLAAEGYPDAPEAGSVIAGAEADFGAGRRGLPRRHGAARRTARWSPPAGGCSTSARAAPTLAEARATAPTPPSPGSTGPAASAARDIGWRALRRLTRALQAAGAAR